ncbi:hypothetical protein F444_17009 [Phytophthora nicotianae P1976]|uniref:Uncharacterized protein n=1 Tax=Phytophthora nicotianae P1976 TaxID=1317066 RepID=A0A080ZGG4_PHYNI|nr:hypothetical protein F444_17009 [Phytophthora nicotianae P1976]
MVKDGQHTANEEIKKATQTVYEASFKKFSDFCSTNGYPEPRHERHYDLPVVLVAYSQSISASSSISLQTAEKARSAVTSYYSPHQNSGGTDVNTWSVREDESGEKRGYGNFTRAVCVSIHASHAFMDSPVGAEGFSEESRVWFKAVSSFAFYGMCRINDVLNLQWKDVTLRQTRCSSYRPLLEALFQDFVLLALVRLTVDDLARL